MRAPDHGMTTVGNWCSRSVVVATANEPLRQVARRIHDTDAWCAVVVNSVAEARPVGVISDRDMLVGMLASVGPCVDDLVVGDVMSLDLVVAHEAEPLTDALALMQRFEVRRMPVVDEQGRLMGLLALDDLIDFLSNHIRFLSGLVAEPRDGRGQHHVSHVSWGGARVRRHPHPWRRQAETR